MRFWWRYFMSASPLTACPFPSNIQRVVSRPSTPTGPRAWIRPVEMPTSAPRPNRKPSANLLHGTTM